MGPARNVISHAIQRLLSTESAWNPKVALGRAVAFLLPATTLRAVSKVYYAYLLQHVPEDWLERDVAIVKCLISPGDHIIDIGACIGSYRKFLSGLVGPGGRVYSFEPIPPSFDILANNIRKLHLGNVELLKHAVSDAERSVTMAVPTYRWGSECWYDAKIASEKDNPSWGRIEVSTITIDTWMRNISARISFIKCDANYHELACLRGALQTLRTSRPALLIEVLPDPDDPTTTAFETFDLLRRESYQIYWFDGKELRTRRPGERSHNYFFFTQAHVDAPQERKAVSLPLSS